MLIAVRPQTVDNEPKKETMDVVQVSSSALCTSRGVQLPPLSAKGEIRPEHVPNIRFRLVEVDAQPLSDQQFNALIKRVVKCFMSEVDITKRLRMVTSRRSVQPSDVELIRNLEALRRNYESERSSLVVKISQDSRFRFNAHHTPESEIAEQPWGKSRKARKSKSLDHIFKNSVVQEKLTVHDVRKARQRQSGGSQPIVCSHIPAPADLSKRLQTKLQRLQKMSETEPSMSEESEAMTLEDSGTVVESESATDLFYDVQTFPSQLE